MNVKIIKLILLSILTISLLMNITQSGVSGNNFYLFIDNDGSIGFQSQIDREVLLTVTSGALNCSNASLYMSKDHGRLVFMNNESTTFTTDFNVSRLQINGVLVEPGVSTSQVLNDVTIIEWWITIEPWLPIMFIFGMIGLVTMFTGPLYLINKWKHHDYYDGARMGILLTAVGFGLFIAWVWMA